MGKQDHIWEYLQGRQTGKEANRLEKEALSDPFLYEALEGLETIKGDHRQRVSELHGHIQKHWLPKQKFRTIYRIGIAAACLMTGGIAVWLLYRPEVPVITVQMLESADSLKGMEKPAIAAKMEPVEQTDSSVPKVILGKTVEPAPAESEEAVIYAEIAEMEETVTDKKRNPLAGATSVVENTNRAIITDVKGHFHLNIPDTIRQLRAFFTGMKSEYAPIPDSGRIHLIMKKAHHIPDGMGDTGYSATSKKTNRKKGMKVRVPVKEWEDEFVAYAADSLRYPEDAREQKIEGKVTLLVHLNRRGRPSRIKVTGKLFPSCDREAIRLVENFPGIWSGRKFDFTIIIPFHLKEEK